MPTNNHKLLKKGIYHIDGKRSENVARKGVSYYVVKTAIALGTRRNEYWFL